MLLTRYKGPRGYQHVKLSCMLYTHDLAKFCTGTTLLIDKYMYISIHNTYIHNYYTLWYALHTHTSGGLSTESFVVVLLYTCTQRYYHTVTTTCSSDSSTHEGIYVRKSDKLYRNKVIMQ